VTDQLFEKYAPVLTNETAPVVRDPRLLIEKSDGISIYYAPFEYLNPEARVVLVGITPGPTQMVNANNAARAALLSGKTPEETLRVSKQIAAFSGEPMRSNLIKQLNDWRFHHWLNIDDAADLFGASQHLLQTTSLLRYPVFANGDDYRGKPDMTRHPLLRQFLLNHFVAEVDALQDAVFVSLGPQVQRVFDSLIREGVLDSNRVIRGMLHPSGNCTYRINYLTGERNEPIPHATNPVPYDEGKNRFYQHYLLS